MHPLINVNQFTAKRHYDSKPWETCTLIRNKLAESRKHNHTDLASDCQNNKRVGRTSAELLRRSAECGQNPSAQTSNRGGMTFPCHVMALSTWEATFYYLESAPRTDPGLVR